MNSFKYRFLSQPRLSVLVLITGGVLGMLAACSSDGGNDAPTPVVSTGGGGQGNGEAPSTGGSTPAHGGSSSHGGSAPTTEAGAGGEAGEAGSTGNPTGTAGTGGAGVGGSGGAAATCPTSDLGFYNQPTTSQSSVFDNVKRLGTHATLPNLPGT
jgi:hypothetical protein